MLIILASNYKPPSTFHGLSYAEVASNSIPDQKERANCLGFRTPIQYTIETIIGNLVVNLPSKKNTISENYAISNFLEKLILISYLH